jgi:hypothetical protein
MFEAIDSELILRNAALILSTGSSRALHFIPFFEEALS